MFQHSGPDRGLHSPWRRVERRSPEGRVVDYVEVGAGGLCGRGVDRAFPAEYREVEGEVRCAECTGGGGGVAGCADAPQGQIPATGSARLNGGTA